MTRLNPPPLPKLFCDLNVLAADELLEFFEPKATKNEKLRGNFEKGQIYL